MRLKSIKLAGFKSFVDPTTVPFPSNLAAVVGPNGCGKSNIIDAVRWVMGESSAKHLRGESMTDVIFNGSNGRKPVGQATIELVFDNSEGKLVGEFSQFNEVSVKRKVTREAQSFYYLNGTKCRRRDITDLFLGTGLGPRSYAIIEQGMISKLIESKPEELRVFLEEAAGISKYKERRRETENRMRRTVENLDRLADIREELERQLSHLHKQSQAAEKYTELKTDERLKAAQLAALKWRKLDSELNNKSVLISEYELELEKILYSRSSAETESDELRLEHHTKNDQLNGIQARFYESGAEIARVEQSLQHQKERADQLQREMREVVVSIDDLQSELAIDQMSYEEVCAEYEELVPEYDESVAQSEESSGRLATMEDRMQEWQREWDQFNNVAASASQKAEVEQSRIQQSESSLMRYEERKQKLEEELVSLMGRADADEIEQLKETISESEMAVEEAHAEKQQTTDSIVSIRGNIAQLDQDLAHERHRFQKLSGELSSKEVLQKSALGGDDGDRSKWFEQNNIDPTRSLAQEVKVTGGWDTAVEVVLAQFIQSINIPSLSGLDESQLQYLKTSVALYEAPSLEQHAEVNSGMLSHYVEGAACYKTILDKVYVCSSFSEAMNKRDGIALDESIVMADGTWMGKHWIVRSVQGAAQSGVLQRQRDIETLTSDVENLEQDIALKERELARHCDHLRDSELLLERASAGLSEQERRLAKSMSECRSLETRFEQIAERINRVKDDIEDLLLNKEQELETLSISRSTWQQAMDEMDQNADEKEILLQRRDDIRASLDNQRQQARHQRDHSHQLQLKVQAAKARQEALSSTVYKLTLQLERVQERHQLLSESVESNADPVEELNIRLESLLDERSKEQGALTKAREELDAVDQRLRLLERNRAEHDQQTNDVRAKLEQQKMEAQALDIHRSGLAEQLKNDNFVLSAVLEILPADAREEDWADELTRIANKVQRLGAINLAAIDEYKVQSERKTYLDAQDEDLRAALETLESAIRKIDRETRARFKETYDKVNNGLQELFPKVFGGGSAYLDLTGDDLLETGVSIMARPPGKKNSTIHLLSGGEKALTAIALIFSIFQLNPAPFCMLDEVDAPLDDANVARYANMVREMSSQVQFIYITHNKIAMEMADQLMGVTMHEPGVSRLVSVDVDEAAALAAL